MIRLSIIVPVYGVEKYIEECIRSLYDQDIPMEEYEVICVDDCSPDNSVAVIEEWRLKVENLKLIRHTENKRQGGARNTGLREAKGKYIWFVDGDDTIQPNCLKGLLEQAESENLDILQIYYAYNGKARKDMIDYGPCTGNEYVFEAPMTDKPAVRCCCVCASIVSRELLEEHRIQFAEHVLYEDDDYAYQMFAYAKRVHLMPLPVYNVRTRENSSTRSKHTVQMAKYYAMQVKRFIDLEPTLSVIDKRWHDLIKGMVGWTCEGMILAEMNQLTVEERKQFYAEKVGYVRGLWRWLPWRTWINMMFDI